MRAGIALGSNLGDRLSLLRRARDKVVQLLGAVPPMLASSVYETEPVHCEPGAGSFLNAVVEIGYFGDPSDLLGELREVERELGRAPDHPRNSSRMIDLDLLYCGDAQLVTPALELPHPRMHERRFVLEPLAEIRPNLVLPGHAQSIAELLRGTAATPPLLRIASEW